MATPHAPITLAPTTGAALLADFDRRRAGEGVEAARAGIMKALAGGAAAQWLECVRAFVLRADVETAREICSAALDEHPDSADLRYALAGLFRQTREDAKAEALLREIVATHHDHVAATFLLARILKDEGRTSAAASAMNALFRNTRHGVNTTIQAIELLDDCGRKQEASAIVEAEIDAGANDVRLHAYAGMLDIQIGEFERARRHYSEVIAGAPAQAFEWQVPHGLAASQRYEDATHPDFDYFRMGLDRSDLSDKARASLLFALGKALDDVGDYAEAARRFAQGNAIVRTFTPWSRKNWRRMIDAKVAAKPLTHRVAAVRDWSPLFIVGVPRSGTTVIAERLSRHADVVNRGELAWLSFLAGQLSRGGAIDASALEKNAATYAAQLRQDDGDGRWFIDKQPLNLLHVDLILALFPDAKIIHCRRNARDTALSLWQQFFLAEEQNFAYDFADIAAVIQGCDRLMTRWQALHAASIRSVRYEDFTTDPDGVIAGLRDWLDLGRDDEAATPAPAISTSSLWQARQAVYTRSVGRWSAYAPYIPELLGLPDA